MTRSKIRVLVVEDSLTVRKRLVEVLRADPELEVCAEAEDGKRGIELCQQLRPDVVTLDMMLPLLSGLAATEYIMAYCPTPILIVSASTNRGELFKTYDALAAGAIDVLDKPIGDEPDDAWERRLVATVKLISRIKVITHLRARLGAPSRMHPPPAATTPGRSVPSAPVRAIAIGVSTGGPAALVDVLGALPATFPLPILLVIHIGRSFAAAFAEWLERQLAIPVCFAEEGQPVAAPQGRVLIAPPDRHMVVHRGLIRLTTEPERNFCRPSVDVLFESLATELGAGVAACLLTGMGRDGAEGLLAVRRAGGRTIAQDEATSIVYGMPREAALLDAAERVLPLAAIGPAVIGLAAATPPRKPR